MVRSAAGTMSTLGMLITILAIRPWSSSVAVNGTIFGSRQLSAIRSARAVPGGADLVRSSVPLISVALTVSALSHALDVVVSADRVSVGDH